MSEEGNKKRTHEDVDANDMANDEILKVVTEMTEDETRSPKEKKKFFQRKHPEFAERYSSLFEMACRPNFDMQKLRFMLAMRSKIQTNSMTVDQASAQVGQAMFNHYVKPIVDVTPPDKKK